MDLISTINGDAFGLVRHVANTTLNLVMTYWAESFYIVLPLLGFYLYMKKDSKLIPYSVAVVVMFVIAEIVKDIVKEPRPCSLADYSWINHVTCESSYSFPSGHATTLTGLFLFLKNYKYIRTAYIIWLIVVLFGRVYLGEHYFTDVVAGAVMGIAGSYIICKYGDVVNRVANKYLGSVIRIIGVNAGNS
jgi:undecaprenyl-diphosphatase